MLSLSFFGTGIALIYNFVYTSNDSANPLYTSITTLTVINSAFFLDFIKPTTLIENAINFDGFSVGIVYPCSGIESMTVFVAAVIAYFAAFKEKRVKRTVMYSVIGIIVLYFMNILRIMILVMVGYYMGNEAMHFAHANLGWIMFVMAMFVFWYFVFE
jgi:exosortase/archaeosortase family protein